MCKLLHRGSSVAFATVLQRGSSISVTALLSKLLHRRSSIPIIMPLQRFMQRGSSISVAAIVHRGSSISITTLSSKLLHLIAHERPQIRLARTTGRWLLNSAHFDLDLMEILWLSNVDHGSCLFPLQIPDRAILASFQAALRS